MESARLKRKPTSPKTIPWEPFKGATSGNTKGCVPVSLPPLIPYRIGSPSSMKGSKSAAVLHSSPQCSSELPQQEKVNGTLAYQQTARYMNCNSKIQNHCAARESREDSAEAERLRHELEAERQLTGELKKLLVASMGDDLTCHIQALSEDKVRLASKMNTIAAQSNVDHDRAEDLEIMSDIWRCKFLAMSVRADELVAQRERLLAQLKNEHQALANLVNAVQTLPSGHIPETVLSDAWSVLSVDISSFCERTPCDERVYRPDPVTSNITVSCCKNCASHEIKLL